MADLADEFVKEFKEKDVIDYLISSFRESVLPIFVNCTINEIVSAVSSIVKTNFTRVPAEKGFELVSLFVRSLVVCLQRWRQIPGISELILNYLRLGSEQVTLGQSNNWIALLSDFVSNCFAEQRHSVFLEGIDLSAVFDSMLLLVKPGDQLPTLTALYDQLSKSKHHTRILKNLLAKCAEMNVLDVNEVVRIIPDEFSQSKLLEMQVLQLKPDTFMETVARITANRNISTAQFITLLTKHEHTIHQVLVTNSDVLIHWLNERSASVIELSNSLLKILCRTDLDHIFYGMRRHLEAATTTTAAFMRLLLWMLLKKEHPKDDVLIGLDRQPPSDELVCVQCYFGSGSFIAYLEARLTGVTSVLLLIDRLTPFLPILRQIPDDLFSQWLSGKSWTTITSQLTRAT
jgi:hypothetical protein